MMLTLENISAKSFYYPIHKNSSLKINQLYGTVQGKILAGGKMGEFGESWTIRKKFLTNIHRYTKNVLGICTDFSSFAKFY